MRKKINVINPVIELDGDEMARIMWAMIREKLILPFLDFQSLLYYDLSIQNRDETDDQVTIDAANAIKQHKVGIKCATITATAARVKEFSLKQMWKSPNGTIRNILDGTIFRAPIIMNNIPRLVPGWVMPFTIGRHALGDQYAAKDMRIKKPGLLQIIFTPDDGSDAITHTVKVFNEPGVALAMYNLDSSIYGFARSCFALAVQKKCNLYFSSKDTILKQYDGRFVEIFAEVYEEYRKQFDALNIQYQHKLIDDMVQFALAEPGNYIWACKNYDGDVQSDMAAKGFGSLGLMTSTLITPDGEVMEAEAAHGTVTAHYRRWQQIQDQKLTDDISTNPIASIFAWILGLRHRAKLDANQELAAFCDLLEETVIKTVESGKFTRDLAILVHSEKKPSREKWLTTAEFIDEVASRL